MDERAQIAATQTSEVAPADLTDADDFTPRYLDPERVRIFRSPMGSARLALENEVCYPRIGVRRIRPLSDPDRYLSLWVGDDAEVGIIVEPSLLDDESLRVVREELDMRYFTPVITKIHKVKERFGVHDWDVETSRGRIEFSVTGLHQNVKQVPPARLIVTDVRNNRYDIPDVSALDRHSYQQIARHL